MNIKVENNKFNFKSGLTSKLLKDLKRVNISEVERDFAKIGVDAKFLNNKYLAGASVLTADILYNISAKYKLPFEALPYAIRAYSDDNLLDEEYYKSIGFCSVDTKKILKDEPCFIGNSLFFNDLLNKIPFLINIENSFRNFMGVQSSSHFLHAILHEWFHNIYNTLIYKTHGYEGECPILKARFGKQNADGLEILQNKDFFTNEFSLYEDEISTQISEYAVSERLISEVFAETMSKIVAESLDKNLNIIKNPLDNIPKNFPSKIKKFLEKTLEV